MTRAFRACVVLAVLLAGCETAERAAPSGAWFDQTVLDEGRQTVVAQAALAAGPMVGCVTDGSARFWVRTRAEADVVVVVYEVPAAPKATGTGASSAADAASEVSEAARAAVAARSATVRTRRGEDFTAVAEVTGLAAATRYRYDVLVDGASALAPDLPSFRTYPPRGEGAQFSVAFGGGARYKPQNERMWDTIRSAGPLAMLFVGDNVYIDKPEDPAAQRFQYYRRQSVAAFRRMTAATAVYAIWDDHDFGTDDCEGGPEALRPAWKPEVWRVFRQNWNNPSYGGGEKQPGCWFRFAIADVDFFMTDGRYYRSFKDGTMLGPVQKAWLLDGLRASRATFKVIASGTLWTEHADKDGRDSWWGVPEEREEIFSAIAREKIDGVVLLSGDRHRSEAWKIERPGSYPLYEFESSKLTNTGTARTRKEALFSYNKGNLFGLLVFDTTVLDPTLTFLVMTINGGEARSLTVKRSDIARIVE